MRDDKRRLSSICAVAKNEGPYLAEWAVYHRMLGFDDILVFDNESTDETSQVLEKLRAAGILRYETFPARTDGLLQKLVYKEGLRLLRPEFQWVALIDIDEFMFIPGFANSLPAFLEAHDHLDAIAINWSMFGSSGHKVHGPGLVMERFTRRAHPGHGANKSIKTLARTDALLVPNVHNHDFAPGVEYQTVSGEIIPPGTGRSTAAGHGVIQINHFFTRSDEEWEAKLARGRPTKPDDHPERARKAKDFEKHNRNEVEDRRLVPYADPVRETLLALGFTRDGFLPVSEPQTGMPTAENSNDRGEERAVSLFAPHLALAAVPARAKIKVDEPAPEREWPKKTAAERDARNVKKWYFAVNEAGLERTRRQIYVAVQSCREVLGLAPNCLFSGADPSRVDDLRRMGVKIIPHRPRLETELREAYGDRYDVFCGHWLRSDLPLIEREDDYILYTDMDVMFRRSLDGVLLPEAPLAAAPEQEQHERRYFNSGVLLMNIPLMRGLLPEFHETIRERLRYDFRYPPHDQASFNEFFHDKMEWLPPEMNWKPYWGVSEQARIVHFHGPKPRQIDRFKKGVDEVRPSLQALWARDPGAYDVYMDEFNRWLAREHAERKARIKARRERRALLSAAPGPG